MRVQMGLEKSFFWCLHPYKHNFQVLILRAAVEPEKAVARRDAENAEQNQVII
jgi:hypothetical protein